MSRFRRFSSSQGLNPPIRNIDNDAPPEMRQELVDVIFHVATTPLSFSPTNLISEDHLYSVISQSIGVTRSGNPFAGIRHAVGRDLGNVEWNRVYDLICRLWPEFSGAGSSNEYREGVNQILSAHGVVWELDEDGDLRRVLPQSAQVQIEAAIQELSQPRFQPAATLFHDARDAYDDQPRRDRDACANIFDAMESVAKEIFSRPNDTFGNVLNEIRRRQVLNTNTIKVLDAVNTLRNGSFGHGMTTPFNLTAPEVDFTYLTCIGGILLFTRNASWST